MLNSRQAAKALLMRSFGNILARSHTRESSGNAMSTRFLILTTLRLNAASVSAATDLKAVFGADSPVVNRMDRATSPAGIIVVGTTPDFASFCDPAALDVQAGAGLRFHSPWLDWDCRTVRQRPSVRRRQEASREYSAHNRRAREDLLAGETACATKGTI
jgi:hypothetical protein